MDDDGSMMGHRISSERSWSGIVRDHDWLNIPVWQRAFPFSSGYQQRLEEVATSSGYTSSGYQQWLVMADTA